MPSQEYVQLILIFLQLLIAFSTVQRLKDNKEDKEKIVAEEDEKDQTELQHKKEEHNKKSELDSIQKQESSSFNNQHSDNSQMHHQKQPIFLDSHFGNIPSQHQEFIPMTPVFVPEIKGNKFFAKTFEQENNQQNTENERSKGKASNKQQKYRTLQDQCRILKRQEKEQQEDDEILKQKLWLPEKQQNMHSPGQGEKKDKNRLVLEKDRSQLTRKRPRIADKYEDIDSDDMIEEGRENQYSVSQVYKVIKKRKNDRIARIDEEKEETRKKEMQLLVLKQQQEKLLKQQYLEMLSKKKEQIMEGLLVGPKISQSLAVEEQNLKNEVKVGGIAVVGDKQTLQQTIPEVQSNQQENTKKLQNILEVKNDKIPENNGKFQGLFANSQQVVGSSIVKDTFSSKQSQGIDYADTITGVQISKVNLIGNSINTSISEKCLPLSGNLHKKEIAEQQLEDSPLKPQEKQETEQLKLDQETNKRIEDVKSQEETSVSIPRDTDRQDNKCNAEKEEPIKEVTSVIQASDAKVDENDKKNPQNTSQVSLLTEKEQAINKTETAKSESDQSITNQTDKPIIENSIFAQPSRTTLPQKNSIFSTGSSSLFSSNNNSSQLFAGNSKTLDKMQPPATPTEQQTNGQMPADNKPSISQQVTENEQPNSTTSALEENKDTIIPKSSLFNNNVSSGAQNSTSTGLFQSLVNKDNGNSLGLGSLQAKEAEKPSGLFGGNLTIQNSQLNPGEIISKKPAEIKGSEINNVQPLENSLKNQENQVQSKDQNSLILPNIKVKSETNQSSSSLFPITTTPGNINNNPLIETTQKSTQITNIFANNPSKSDGVPSLFSGNNNSNTQQRSLFSNLQGTGLFQPPQISVGIQPSTQQQG